MTDRHQDDVTEVAETLLGRLERAEHIGSPTAEPPKGILGVLHRIRVGIEGVSDTTGSIAAILSWVVFLLGLFNVVTRYGARFIARDIIVAQAYDLQWMMFGALFLLGFNYAVKEDVNPRIDFWWTNFSLRTKAIIDLVFHVVLFLPFLWVAIQVLWSYSMQAMGRNFDGSWSTWRVWEIWEQSTDAGGLPRGPIKLLMVVGFVFFASQIIAQLIKAIMVLAGREDLSGLAEHKAPRRVE